MWYDIFASPLLRRVASFLPFEAPRAKQTCWQSQEVLANRYRATGHGDFGTTFGTGTVVDRHPFAPPVGSHQRLLMLCALHVEKGAVK